MVAEPRRLHLFLPPDNDLSVASLARGDGRLSALVRLLALAQPVAVGDARRALAPAVVEDLQSAGLVTLSGDHVIANYRLVPHNGLLLAGDRPDMGERELVHPFTEPSLTLARLTPRSRIHSMLDLGTGSGVLALLGASHCDSVTAVDINQRALMFARFNAALNEVGNIALTEGSWFEPVAGRRFDLIVGNPPYVVSPDQAYTYRDSGMPPGALLEMVCREGAKHLEPGGRAIFLCSWPHASGDDWADVPTAAVSDTGCDALILCQNTVDPLDHAAVWNAPPVRWLGPESLRETVARWLGYYSAIGAKKISFGAVVMRRRGSGEPWISALRARAPVGERGSEQLVRLLAGLDLSHSLDDSALLDWRFSVPDGLDVSQRFQRRQSRFVSRPAMVSLDRGLGVRAAIDPDALDLLFACDGTLTLGEIVVGVAQRLESDPGALATIAAEAARVLLGHGLLEADRRDLVRA